MSIQLTVTPRDSSVVCNITTTLNNINEYVVFYHRVGYKQIKSITSVSPSNIVISNLINSYSYYFYASAYTSSLNSGNHMVESLKVQCTPSAVPSQPILSVSSSHSGLDLQNTAVLTWSASICSLPIQSYKIYRDDVLLSSVDGSVLTFTDTNLTYGQSYSYQLSAVALVGESLKSLSSTVLISSVPSICQNLKVNYDEANPTLVDLSWEAPVYTNGSNITSYTIQYSLDPSFQSGIYSVSSNQVSDSINDSQLTIPSANFSTSTGWYYFRVSANNSIGMSPWTSIATIQPKTVPIAVQNLSSVNNGDGSITLSWNYAIDEACPLLGYLVSYLDENNDLEAIYVHSTNTTINYTITDLLYNTTYDFNVYAINMLGVGDGSEVSQLVSKKPLPPTITNITHSNTSISLSFTLGDSRGSTILGTKLFQSTDNINFTQVQTSTDPTVLSYTINHLVNGTTYYFYVKSYNANGDSDASNSEFEIPSSIPANVPSGDISLVNNLNETLTLSLSFNPSDLTINGGAEITSVNIYDYFGGFIASITSPWTYLFDKASGVANGNDYSFNVAFVNLNGESATKISSPRIHVSSYPSPVSSFSIVSSGVYSVITVNPGNGNGASITNKKIYKSSDGSIYSALANLDANTDTYQDLINGVISFYEVSDVNANGESSKSNPFSNIILNITHQSANGVLLNWNNPSDDTTSFQIYQSTDGTSYSCVFTLSSSLNSYTINNITNGTMYWFYVVAQLPNGSYIQSNPVSDTPSQSPSSVINVVGNAYNTYITVEWGSPLNDGGLPYTYSLKVYTEQGTAYSQTNMDSTTSFWQVNNLQNGVSYSVDVWAVNAVDTDFNIYTFNITPASVPVVSSLTSNVSNGTLYINWNCISTSNIRLFDIVVYDKTLDLLTELFISLSDPNLIVNGSVYSYPLTKITTQFTNFSSSDVLRVLVNGRNNVGISNVAGQLNIN